MLQQILNPLTRLLEDLKFRDRESFKAFHDNVYLVFLPVCSLGLSHTEGDVSNFLLRWLRIHVNLVDGSLVNVIAAPGGYSSDFKWRGWSNGGKNQPNA